MSVTRFLGILLFLPVPIVLALFTSLPLGPLPSLGAGLALMLTHPIYARPWALRRAGYRCLWCGADSRNGVGRNETSPQPPQDDGTTLLVHDPRGHSSFHHCSPAHCGASERTLAFAWRFRFGLRFGIFGSLLVLLGLVSAASFGKLSGATPSDGVAFFRLGVALAVLPLGWWGSRATSHRATPRAPNTRTNELRAPFPIHVAATIGIANVLWLFRIIGLIWLVQGTRHFLTRT